MATLLEKIDLDIAEIDGLKKFNPIKQYRSNYTRTDFVCFVIMSLAFETALYFWFIPVCKMAFVVLVAIGLLLGVFIGVMLVCVTIGAIQFISGFTQEFCAFLWHRWAKGGRSHIDKP